MTTNTDRPAIAADHCQLCGSTDPEDVAGREDGRYYSGCCNEPIADECAPNCGHDEILAQT